MKTRVIIFRNDENKVRFAIGPLATFEQEITEPALNAFAELLNLTRHTKFDWAVGDAGKKCALLELSPQKEMPHALQSWRWLSFPEAARSLSEGEDRRYLQLAVQYVAAGGIDDSVTAFDYDKKTLDEIRIELEKNNSGTPPDKASH
jgi:hypothetical protein